MGISLICGSQPYAVNSESPEVRSELVTNQLIRHFWHFKPETAIAIAHFL
jgi:hypothetical protein